MKASRRVVEALEDMVRQFAILEGPGTPEGYVAGPYSSGYLSATAEAMDVLVELGRWEHTWIGVGRGREIRRKYQQETTI